jgi:hypothetical protein
MPANLHQFYRIMRSSAGFVQFAGIGDFIFYYFIFAAFNTDYAF